MNIQEIADSWNSSTENCPTGTPDAPPPVERARIYWRVGDPPLADQLNAMAGPGETWAMDDGTTCNQCDACPCDCSKTFRQNGLENYAYVLQRKPFVSYPQTYQSPPAAFGGSLGYATQHYYYYTSDDQMADDPFLGDAPPAGAYVPRGNVAQFGGSMFAGWGLFKGDGTDDLPATWPGGYVGLAGPFTPTWNMPTKFLFNVQESYNVTLKCVKEPKGDVTAPCKVYAELRTYRTVATLKSADGQFNDPAPAEMFVLGVTEVLPKDYDAAKGFFRFTISVSSSDSVQFPPGDYKFTMCASYHIVNPPGGAASYYVCDNYIPDESAETWWIGPQKNLSGGPGNIGVNPPMLDWLGGPHPSKQIAMYWRDKIGVKYYCVTWHDHEGNPDGGTFTPAVGQEPQEVGIEYMECLAQNALSSQGVTLSPGLVLWGLKPRSPRNADEPNIPRKLSVSNEDGWYSEITEYPVTDNLPDTPYPYEDLDDVPAGFDPDSILAPTTDNPNRKRFEVHTTDGNGGSLALPWRGYEARQSALQKCRQNCPRCSRLRKCLIIDAFGNASYVEMPEAGSSTDWRKDLPAIKDIVSAMGWSKNICEWICSNPCNQLRFPNYCDPGHPSYVGCHDVHPWPALPAPVMMMTGRAPDLSEADFSEPASAPAVAFASTPRSAAKGCCGDPATTPAKAARVPLGCASLGERIEYRADCASGVMCRWSCTSAAAGVAEHLGGVMETVPGQDCIDCPGYRAKIIPTDKIHG